MSKKLPKENLKKVSGGAAPRGLADKGLVGGAESQSKKVAGKNVLPGQVAGGRNALDKGVIREKNLGEIE